MSHAVLPSGSQIGQRYETHREKPLQFYVTRQNQEFNVNLNLTFCDVELTRASVQLVGDPGLSNWGVVNQGIFLDDMAVPQPTLTPMYGNSINNRDLAFETSVVRGNIQPNAIVSRPEIDHGWCNISIRGMTENVQFMRDNSDGRPTSFVVPTDFGLIANRAAQQNTEAKGVKLQMVKLENRLTVSTSFLGLGNDSRLEARFVEDWANEDVSTRREFGTKDGDVKYFETEVYEETKPCLVPPNLIQSMFLEFKITPRTDL